MAFKSYHIKLLNCIHIYLPCDQYYMLEVSLLVFLYHICAIFQSIEIYIALLQRVYSEAPPTQARLGLKKAVLEPVDQ